jgi:hypothetical protein
VTRGASVSQIMFFPKRRPISARLHFIVSDCGIVVECHKKARVVLCVCVWGGGAPCDKIRVSFDFHEILFDCLTELSDRTGLTSDAGEVSLNLGLRTGNLPCVSSVYPGAYQLVTFKGFGTQNAAYRCGLRPEICVTAEAFNRMGRNSSVSKVTRYGLDGPGFESRWGRDFPHPSRKTLEPTQPPIHWVLGLSRG